MSIGGKAGDSFRIVIGVTFECAPVPPSHPSAIGVAFWFPANGGCNVVAGPIFCPVSCVPLDVMLLSMLAFGAPGAMFPFARPAAIWFCGPKFEGAS